MVIAAAELLVKFCMPWLMSAVAALVVTESACGVVLAKLKVCVPVKVWAASVRAIVADVEGNVMVVVSVPANVRLLLKRPFFPLIAVALMGIHNQEVVLVPDVNIQVINNDVRSVTLVFFSKKIVLPPEDCIVNVWAADAFTIRNDCPTTIVDATGITIV